MPVLAHLGYHKLTQEHELHLQSGRNTKMEFDSFSVSCRYKKKPSKGLLDKRFIFVKYKCHIYTDISMKYLHRYINVVNAQIYL